MDRLTSSNKRVLLGAALALLLVAAPGIALALRADAQDAPAQEVDILKFSTNGPAIIVNQIRADKAAEFEDGWVGVRALIAKSENAEMKAFGETLNKLYKVDQDPFDVQGTKAVLYIFQLDSPSTTYSYNPGKIIYEYLKAGLEGSKITRPEADAVYEKLKGAYLAINPPWKLVKAK